MSNDKRDNEPTNSPSYEGARESRTTPNRDDWSMTVDQICDMTMVTLRDAGNCELQPDQLSDLRQARTWVKGLSSQLGPMDVFFNFGLQGGWSEHQLIDLWMNPDCEVGEPDAVMGSKQMGLEPMEPETMAISSITLDMGSIVRSAKVGVYEITEVETNAYHKIHNALSEINHSLCAKKDNFASLVLMIAQLRDLQTIIYLLNVKAGWWSDLETGEPKVRNDGELLMLMVTELAEAMEGVRKNLMDDKLPHRKMVEVELADTIIRILDYAGGRNLDVAGALIEKLAFNQTREDHTRAARLGSNGKKV